MSARVRRQGERRRGVTAGRWWAARGLAVALGVLLLGLAAPGCESGSGSKTNTTPGAGQDAAGGDGGATDTTSSADGTASASTCTCETPGVTLSSTCAWPDAEACEGWVSMTVENDPALKEREARGDAEGAMTAALAKPFPSGTEQCAFECCTTITCP